MTIDRLILFIYAMIYFFLYINECSLKGNNEISEHKEINY